MLVEDTPTKERSATSLARCERRSGFRNTGVSETVEGAELVILPVESPGGEEGFGFAE